MANIYDIGGSIGKAIDVAAPIIKAVNPLTKLIPEMGVSERLQSAGGTYGSPQTTSQGQVQGTATSAAPLGPVYGPSPITTTSGGGSSTPGGGGSTGSGEDFRTQFLKQNGRYPTASETPGYDPNALMSMISEKYAPALALLGQAEASARTGAEEDSRNLENRVAKSAQDIEAQKGELLTGVAGEEATFNKTLQQALNAAVNAMNALMQQRNARFGGGSSAGEAIGELAKKEFFRQQGAAQQQGLEGAQQFSQERTKIETFTRGKLDDLNLYKDQALSDIQKNLRSSLLEIQARQGDIESNKTVDKINALQAAMDRVQAVQDADRQLRQQIALSAIQQMQEVEGRAFTPAEIKVLMDDFVAGIPSSVGGSEGVTGTTIAKKPTTRQDDLSSLLNTPYVSNLNTTQTTTPSSLKEVDINRYLA